MTQRRPSPLKNWISDTKASEFRRSRFSGAPKASRVTMLLLPEGKRGKLDLYTKKGRCKEIFHERTEKAANR